MIAERWLSKQGFAVTRPSSSESDRGVNGVQVEVKFSTLWDTGVYKFQQIRDQNYEYAILLGVSPEEVQLWCVPKTVLLAHSTPQHTGASGTETRWLSFDPTAVPSWLQPYGGTPDQALAVITAAFPPLSAPGDSQRAQP